MKKMDNQIKERNERGMDKRGYLRNKKITRMRK